MYNFNSQTHISKYLETKNFHLQPRFTTVHHPIRKKFGLSLMSYAVIDSIHQLSHRPDHPWCSQSKLEIAKFLDISERHAFRAVKEGIDKGLIERSTRGDLRSTDLWINQVVLYITKPRA